MNRIPYGSFQKMSKKQQCEHKPELARRYRMKHRKELNAKNKRYIDLWKITKPFVVQCQWCGDDFNACRRYIRVCPNCHQKEHNRAEAIKMLIIARRNAKAYLMDKVVELHKKGLSQKEIAHELDIPQRNVSNYLLKMGIRTQKYRARRK